MITPELRKFVDTFNAAWLTLTDTERAVMQERCRGFTSTEIGARMEVSPLFVRTYTAEALRKLKAVVTPASTEAGRIHNICWRVGYQMALRDTRAFADQGDSDAGLT